jgi:PAS domain S-box-containing protein
LDNLPGIFARAWPDGNPQTANRTFLQYFGKKLEEVGKWRMGDIIHPDDLAQVTKAIENGISGGQPFEYEHRIRRFDGVYLWFHSRWAPVHDSQGSILYWNILVTDINDRKQAEEALQSSERNLRLMINVIPTYIHVLRPNGSVIYVNPAVLEYTGLTLEEVQRENYRERAFHPEDVERLREEHRQALTRSVPFENEQRMLDKEGRYRWFLIRYNPLLDEQGKTDRWYAAAIDIDDRKLAEEALRERELNLRQITETIPEMLWSSTPEGSIDYCNGRLLEFTGFSPADVQGTRWIKLLHPDDVEHAVKAWSHCVKTGDPYRVEVRTIHAPDQTYRWCVTRALPLVDSGGRIVKWHGTVVDMHDWKVAQEELRSTQAELARVLRVATLNVLTASIAHEINQPLASLITNASISFRRLNDDPPNVDGARETVQRTIRDANRASDVVTRLRALFSKKEFTPETFDLNEITREVVALSLTDLQGNRVILQLELAANLPLVTGDRVQLQQVTLNLLHNASDAMVGIEDRPRDLLIRTQQDGDNQVRLSVQDAGCGVNPKEFERLFEPFHTTKSTGMGIGLSISRSIIEKHKGRLWAVQNDGPGTTFFFSIPCSPDSSKDATA